MTKPIDNLQAWRVFIKTAQTGSVSQAAASLRMEISTASRLIQGIEREFGSLFEHAKRPLLVNSRGRSLLRTLEPLIDHFDNLQSLSRFASERPVIRISAPIALANKFIYRYIFDYRRINPNVQFKLFSQQNLTELIGNTVDIALLRRPNPSPDLIILPFVTWGGFPVASPQYLALNGEPATPGDLARHIGILHRGGEYPITTTLLKGNQRSDLIKWERVYVFDDQGIILNAVMENIGISLDLSATIALHALQQGSIVPILKNWRRSPWEFCIVCNKASYLQNREIKEFVDWWYENHKGSVSDRVRQCEEFYRDYWKNKEDFSK